MSRSVKKGPYVAPKLLKRVEEMNETLVSNWNDRVAPSDIVFVLGDLFFRCDDPEPILDRLAGRKRLILRRWHVG